MSGDLGISLSTIYDVIEGEKTEVGWRCLGSGGMGTVWAAHVSAASSSRSGLMKWINFILYYIT